MSENNLKSKSPILYEKIQNELCPATSDVVVKAWSPFSNKDKEKDKESSTANETSESEVVSETKTDNDSPFELSTLNSKFIDLALFLNEDNPHLLKSLKNFFSSPESKELSINLFKYDDFNIFVGDKKDKKVIEKYFENKKLNIQKLIPEWETFESFETALQTAQDLLAKITKHQAECFKTMKLNNFSEMDNDGTYKLYLSHFFLRGYVKDMEVNAPLITYQVNLKVKNDSEVRITKQNLTFNTRLFLFLEKHNNNYTPLEPNIAYHSEQELFDKIKENLLTLPTVSEATLDTENFLTFEALPTRSLGIYNNFALHLIEPEGGSIVHDIKILLEKDEAKNVFAPAVASFQRNKEATDAILDAHLVNIGALPLNYNQKLAAVGAQTENAVIYGPPGTGKSETIATIIANNIINGGTVLMCSEKKPALEEVFSRLQGLNLLALPIFTNQKETIRETIAKIHELFEIVERNPSLSSFVNDDAAATTILIEKLTKIRQILTKKIEGKSLNDLMNEYNKIPYLTYQEMIQKEVYSKIKQIEHDYVASRTSEKKIQDIIAETEKPLKALNYLKQNLIPEHYNFIFESVWNNDEMKTSFIQKIFEIKSINDASNSLSKTELAKWESFFLNLLSSKTVGNISLDPPKLKTHLYEEEKLQKFYRAFVVLNNFKKSYQNLLDYNIVSHYVEYADSLKMITRWLNALDFKSMDELINLDINDIYSEYKHSLSSNNNTVIKKIFTNYITSKYSEYKSLPREKQILVTELFSLSENRDTMPSIQFVIRHYYEQLKWLFPIWIMMPLQVAALTPLNKGEFKYGIFDEASQMFMEKSIPLLYRSEIKIVAGDDKQMKPERQLNKPKFVADAEDKANDFTRDNVDSLLDKAQLAGWKTYHFSNHYRATKDTQIKFVNQHVYNKTLTIVPTNCQYYNDLIVKTFPNAIADDVNETEIEEVIRLLMQNHKNYKKMMAIFANSKTANKCQDYFSRPDIIMKLANPDFSLSAEKERKTYPKTKASTFKELTKKRTKELKEVVLPSNVFPNANLVFSESQIQPDTTTLWLTTAKTINPDNFENIYNYWIENYVATLDNYEGQDKLFKVIEFLEGWKITPEIISFYLEKGSNSGSTASESKPALFTREDYDAVFEKMMPSDDSEPSITLKNVDNCQGSEADLVIISFGFAKKTNKDGKSSFSVRQVMKFSKEGGLNTLNVMITRNKRQTIVLKSINYEDLPVVMDAKEKPDLKVFCEYIKYLDNLSSQQEQEVNPFFVQDEIISNPNHPDKWDDIWLDIISSIKLSFPEEFVNQLVFKTNFELGNQKIDFAIFNKWEQAAKVLILKNKAVAPQNNSILDTADKPLTRDNVLDLLFVPDNSSTATNIAFIPENFSFLDKVDYLTARQYNVRQLLDFSYKVNREEELRKIMKAVATPAKWRQTPTSN